METGLTFNENDPGLQIITLTRGNLNAKAVLIAPPRGKDGHQELLVLKGSIVNLYDVESCPEQTKKIRSILIQNGAINKDGVLYRHILFDNPSQAANVITGSSKDGWKEWRLQNPIHPFPLEATSPHAKKYYYKKPADICFINAGTLISDE